MYLSAGFPLFKKYKIGNKMPQKFRLISKLFFFAFTITTVLNETGTACSFFDWLFPTEVSPLRQSRPSRASRHVRTGLNGSGNGTVWIEVDGGMMEVDTESMLESQHQAQSKPYWRLLKGSGDYDIVRYNGQRMRKTEAVKLWFSSMTIDDNQTQSLIRDLHGDYHYKGYDDAFLSSVEESSEEYTKRINFLDALDKKREADLEKQREEYQYLNEFEATWKGQQYSYWLNNSQRPSDNMMNVLHRANIDKREREREQEAKKHTALLSSFNKEKHRKEAAKRREEEARQREATRRREEEAGNALKEARSRPYYYKGSHPSDGLAERVDFRDHGIRIPRTYFPSHIPR